MMEAFQMAGAYEEEGKSDNNEEIRGLGGGGVHQKSCGNVTFSHRMRR